MTLVKYLGLNGHRDAPDFLLRLTPSPGPAPPVREALCCCCGCTGHRERGREPWVCSGQDPHNVGVFFGYLQTAEHSQAGQPVMLPAVIV